MATFVLAVETTKSYLTMLSRNFSQLVTSWKHHWSLRQLQRLSPETAIATKLSEGELSPFVGRIHFAYTIFHTQTVGVLLQAGRPPHRMRHVVQAHAKQTVLPGSVFM